MTARFVADRPDTIPMRLEICLPLGEWRQVRAALEKSGEHTHYGPLGVVCDAIRSMVRQAECVWEPEKP